MRKLKNNNSNKPSRLNTFLVSELSSQNQDENQKHLFLPLSELESLLKRSPVKDESKIELISKFKKLEKIWNFVVEDGKPIGVELANSQNQYAVIVPDESEGFGIQYFNGTGLNGYEYVSKSSYEAFEKALLIGFDSIQPGMMEYLSSQPLWIRNNPSLIHDQQPSINHNVNKLFKSLFLSND